MMWVWNLLCNFIFDKKKQKNKTRFMRFSWSTVLLIPTVCCQDVTVPVRDKVAIILPPLSSPLWIQTCDSHPQATSQCRAGVCCLRVSLLTPAQVSKPAHRGRRSYTVKTGLWLAIVYTCGLSQCICVTAARAFSHRVFESDLWMD